MPRSLDNLSALQADDPDNLSARAQAWWTTRDPRVLWPALEPTQLQPAADAIGAAVAMLLRGEPATLGSPRGEDAYAIGIAALLSGTGPLLGGSVEQGSLDVSDPVAYILAEHLFQARVRADRIAHEVAPALDRLVAVGIQPWIIKGFHTAYEYFPEPGVRPIADVDIVVAAEAIEQAEDALRAASFAPSPSIARPYKRDWYPASDDGRIWSLELFDARDRWTIELHDGVNFYGLPASDLSLRIEASPKAPGHPLARSVRTPTQPLLTAILATHLSAELHTRCLLRVVELVLVLRRDRDRGLLDWNSLKDFLDESGATRFAYPALTLVEKLVPGTVEPALLSHARRASTRLTRSVADRLTPTFPILDNRLILAERLMWVANGRQMIQAAASWLRPVAGRPWRDVVNLYHSRLLRLFGGRASWTPGPKQSEASSPRDRH